MRAVRFLILLLFVIAIPFNAVHAAGAGLCDVLGEEGGHGGHVGHHVHDAHDHDDSANTDPAQPGSDHNHTHAHPLLSWMLPAPVGVHPVVVANTAPPWPDENFVSALAVPLDRPPRHAVVV